MQPFQIQNLFFILLTTSKVRDAEYKMHVCAYFLQLTFPAIIFIFCGNRFSCSIFHSKMALLMSPTFSSQVPLSADLHSIHSIYRWRCSPAPNPVHKWRRSKVSIPFTVGAVHQSRFSVTDGAVLCSQMALFLQVLIC